jgi:hypothetical protein
MKVVRMRKAATDTANQSLMALLALVKSIVAGDTAKVLQALDASSDLVWMPAQVGATRQEAAEYFFPEIRHYIYSGDTALHMAAAAFNSKIVQILVDRGANPAAKNRRGAEPVHYASDANTFNPSAQAETIECLLRAGANPNALDKSGVAPLHRAVRTRCAAAVETLIRAGADPNLPNGRGSTPLHLAVQNTGRGGSGTSTAIEQQRQIIIFLLANGASPSRNNSAGKTVHQLVTADWMRDLLRSR